MLCEYNEKCDSCCDEDDCENDGADAIEYGSCQSPFILLFLLFFFVLISILQMVADLL